MGRGDAQGNKRQRRFGSDLWAGEGRFERDFNGVIIRVRGGKAEISLYEVEGRRDVRALTESEFEELKSFTSRQEVEDLGPEGYGCPITEVVITICG